MKNIFVLALFLVARIASSQVDTSFWQLPQATPALENEFNLSIASDTTNNILYVGTSKGLFKSVDEGQEWWPVYTNSPVFFIGVYDSSLYLVGLEGMVYNSHNWGMDWDSTQLEGVSQITDLLILPNGHVFISTGEIIVTNEVAAFRGQGIFRTVDNGSTWEKVNTGIGTNKYVAYLEADKQGRIYAAVNEYNYHDGVLHYSNDEGDSWQTIPNPNFDWGDGSIGNTDIVTFTSLAVLPNDDIVIALNGAKGNVGTIVCLYNSLDSALSETPWQHMRIFEFGYPWLYNVPHNIHVAKNGDVYVNRIEDSFIRGSVFYSNNGGHTFARKPVDFATYSNVYFAQCHYAELSNGRIFVVQEFDANVYATDSSMRVPTEVKPEHPVEHQKIAIYPNPASDFITLKFTGDAPESISVLSMKGEELIALTLEDGNLQSSIAIDFLPTGIYLLKFKFDGAVVCKKMIVQ